MITMRDIAEEAGVSRTTVSFVLNRRCHQDQRISESVQKKVLDTARKLGYMRNDLVLSLVKGRSHAIGIVSDFRDFMFPEWMPWSVWECPELRAKAFRTVFSTWAYRSRDWR